MLGRPIAAALAGCYADPVVWECSHTGGHRFAPVLILLPTGYTYGRVTGAQAKEVLDGARSGVVSTTGLRGRSSTVPIAQAAEVAVRNLLGPVGPDVLRVEVGPGAERKDADAGSAVVRHEDGRGWRATVTAHDLPERMMSCGKKPSPTRAWSVSDLIADEN